MPKRKIISGSSAENAARKRTHNSDVASLHVDDEECSESLVAVKSALQSLHLALKQCDGWSRVDSSDFLSTLCPPLKQLYDAMVLHGCFTTEQYASGDRVFATWKNDAFSGLEYAGTIIRESLSSSSTATDGGGESSERRYEILFDDGDKDLHCPVSWIRPAVAKICVKAIDPVFFADMAWRIHLLGHQKKDATKDEETYPDLWRDRLVVGDMIDILDMYNVWCKAEVVAVCSQLGNDLSTATMMGTEEGDSGGLEPGEPRKIKVSFLGWEADWDEWVDGDSDRIQPWKSKTAERWTGDYKSIPCEDRLLHPVDRLQRRMFHLLFRLPTTQELVGSLQEALLSSPHYALHGAIMPVEEDPVRKFHNERYQEYHRVFDYLRNEVRRTGCVEEDVALQQMMERLEPIVRTGASGVESEQVTAASLLPPDIFQRVAAFLDAVSICNLQASRKAFVFLDSAPSFAATLSYEFEDTFRDMNLEDRVRLGFRRVYVEQFKSRASRAATAR